LENTGNVNLLDILVEDIISGFTNFIQANQGGNYNVADHTVSWSVSQLDPGEILSLELVVSVADNAEHESVISNMATAESVQTLLVESNSTEILAIHLLELQLAAQNHVNCYGDSTGSILIDVTGGIAPYTFGWQHDPAQTGKEVSNLPIGTYIVNVEDALGNTDEMSVTILQPDGPLNGYLNVPNVQCPGESIGMIELDVNGGTAPYAYLWSNSAITQNIEGLSAGTYSVIITDANGCTWSAEAIIEQSDEAMLIHDIVIDDVVCKDDPEGSISFEISGGTPSYTFLWNNNDTTRSLSGIPGGDYSLIVTDANGCQLLNDFFVDYQYEACEINVPGGLTPNSELDNILLIRGLEKYPNNSLKIFNRYGTMVFDASPYQNDWTGEPDSNYLLVESDGKLPSGTYFYVLVLEPGYEPLTGYIYLIKE
jgi:gliding motility-associated-like protein